jgi:hypothetical protein
MVRNRDQIIAAIDERIILDLSFVRGHGSNVEQWPFCFRGGTAPVPSLVLEMNRKLNHLIADMFLFQIR